MSARRAPPAAERLAIDGGRPVRARPMPPWPVYGADEIEAVERVLRSGRVSYWTGDEGAAFEAEFARHLGRRHALALANGTVALELALRALGIGDGDEVIVTPRSFVASAGAVVQVGARPVFVDVDRDSQNIGPEQIEPAITPRTRAVLTVHLAGWPCAMERILQLAEKHGLMVVEDCAQAHGARCGDRPVGSFGDAAVFSFCQDKIMSTCGEGGMLVIDDEAAWRAAWSYKDHGKSYEGALEREHPPGYRYLHETIGTNFRLTEAQAAVGRIQLTKLTGWVERRRRHAAALIERWRARPALRVPAPDERSFHSYYKLYAFLRLDRLKAGWSRDRVVEAVNAEGVPCFHGACPEIYLERAFRGHAPARRLPVARELGETSLMLPVHPTLTDEDIDDTGRAVEKVLEAATG